MRPGALAFALFSCGAACGSASAPATPPAPPSAVEASTRPEAARSTLPSAIARSSASAPSVEREATTTSLDVPGYLPAVLVVPPTTTRSPLVIVTHGAGDRPEPDCARYEALTKQSAFVLCLRGRAMNAIVPEPVRRYYYDGHIELGKELVAAVRAVEDAYGDRVDAADLTFAGYSQGAAMGILYLERGGAREAKVRRVLLVEGGSGEFTVAVAESLKKDGVDRVAMVCGQQSCHARADRSVRWLQQANLEVNASFAPGAGHTSGGAVSPLVEAAWGWLVDGDPRFDAPSPIGATFEATARRP